MNFIFPNLGQKLYDLKGWPFFKPCPQCGGDGTYSSEVMARYDDEPCVCDRCAGKGYVLRYSGADTHALVCMILAAGGFTAFSLAASFMLCFALFRAVVSQFHDALVTGAWGVALSAVAYSCMLTIRYVGRIFTARR